MLQRTEPWSIPGSDGQPIIGNSHLPDGRPRGILIIAHGFKGYKDYGMFPRIAMECARAGLIAHRFNFSHSGMTNNVDTFERADLFEHDTWNKQVSDLRHVVDGIHRGQLPTHSEGAAGSEDESNALLPYVLFGHSRGGVAAILAAGRFADDPSFPQPAGVITAASPATANSLSNEAQLKLLRQGYLDSPSSRTGQNLRLGRAFLDEQLDDPANHDVLLMVQRIRCPLLIIHGEEDPTVSATAAHALAAAAGAQARVLTVPGADHVFNTPNPFPVEPPPEPGPQLAAVLSAVTEFAIRMPPKPDRK